MRIRHTNRHSDTTTTVTFAVQACQGLISASGVCNSISDGQEGLTTVVAMMSITVMVAGLVLLLSATSVVGTGGE